MAEAMMPIQPRYGLSLYSIFQLAISVKYRILIASSAGTVQVPHFATVRMRQHRQQEMFPLVGCHSLKGSHWSIFVLRRYSATVRVQQRRQQ